MYYTSISGNAFEDIKNMEGDLAQATGMPSTNGVKDNDEKYISDIYVELLDSDGNVVSTQRTGSDGSYCFSGFSGSYSVRFRYGYLGDTNMNQSESVKNILKYNGNDYFSTSVGNSGNALDSYTREIIISGKGCAQVFLTIDISPSMIEETYHGRSRISYEIDAARNLIDSLLSNDDNTYIGIVAFAEKSLLIQNLTQNKDLLNQKLDTLLQYARVDVTGALTNIKDAITLTGESFVNTTADSNRLILLLSDGIPLTEGSGNPEMTLYAEDLEPENTETLDKKLNAIVGSTKAEMQRLIDEGVYMISLVTITGDAETDNLVNRMCTFDNENTKFFHADDADVTNIITNYVKELIMKNVTENLREFSEYIPYLKGCDNEARRQEVTQNFETMTANQDRLFKMIDNYTPSIANQTKAKELSDKSYMIAQTGTYPLDNVSVTSVEGGWNVGGTFYSSDEYNIVETSWSGQNLALSSRDPFALETEMKVSGVRITLSDGRELFYDVDKGSAFMDADLAPAETKELRDVKGPVLLYYLDREIMAGSTLEIEYTIGIRNPSPVSSDKVTLMSYIPDGLSFDPNATLLTMPGKTNSTFGWKAQSDLNIEDNPTNICVTTELENCDAFRNGTIGNNGERYAKVVFNKRLNNTNDISNFKAGAEIFQYSNVIGRRMQSYSSISATQVQLNSMYVASQNESDFSKALSVTIIPPTGISITQQIITYLLAITCICTFIILLKKHKTQK